MYMEVYHRVYMEVYHRVYLGERETSAQRALPPTYEEREKPLRKELSRLP